MSTPQIRVYLGVRTCVYCCLLVLVQFFALSFSGVSLNLTPSINQNSYMKHNLAFSNYLKNNFWHKICNLLPLGIAYYQYFKWYKIEKLSIILSRYLYILAYLHIFTGLRFSILIKFHKGESSIELLIVQFKIYLQSQGDIFHDNSVSRETDNCSVERSFL